MSTNKKQEVAIVGNNSISKEEILKNGIEIKVNQNDIIDLIVAERIEEIHKKAEYLKERAISICKKIEEEYQKELLKSTDFLSISKNKKMKIERKNGPGFANRYSEESVAKVLYLSCSNNSRGDFMYYYREGALENSVVPIKNMDVHFQIGLETIINNVVFRGTKVLEIKDFCASESLVKEIKDHNKEVNKFCKTFNNLHISENSIAKQIKKEFTKGLVQSMDKDFVKKLNDKFKLNV